MLLRTPRCVVIDATTVWLSSPERQPQFPEQADLATDLAQSQMSYGSEPDIDVMARQIPTKFSSSHVKTNTVSFRRFGVLWHKRSNYTLEKSVNDTNGRVPSFSGTHAYPACFRVVFV